MAEKQSNIERELHEAIEKWRETWKKGSIDEVLELYTENVRVMRSGKGLIVGRPALKCTLEQFEGMGLRDIDFVSDEICAMPSIIGTNSDSGSGMISMDMAWQRYHEVLVREDGSEISTIYGMMIWKKVSGVWLIDAYANCDVPPEQQNTQKLRESIQHTFDQFCAAWVSLDATKCLDFFSNDCLFVAPGSAERLKGKVAISQWLEKIFKKGDWRTVSLVIENVLPMANIYIVSQIVHVTCPDVCIKDGDGKVIMRGGGNALVKWNSDRWEILEAIWNLNSC